MKKYISILTITLTILVSSCSDQLEILPIDQLVEETAYRTVNDLQLGLNGAIGNYSPTGLVRHNSVFADNVKIGSNNGGQLSNELGQILNANLGDQGLWTSRYSAMNDFNRLFEAANGIAPELGEEDTYNNILAQAHAFRALMHYELLLYYGENMRNSESPGVPYVDYVSASATPARNTTGEVLAAIDEDLTNALALFPAGTSDINFATPDFVTFLRARIALESGNYPAAISFASSIISNYDLANPAEYLAMFREDANTKEVIWKYDSVQGFNLGLHFVWNFTGPSPFGEVSNGLEADLPVSDIRRVVNIDPDSEPDDNIFIVGKYPANADTQAINDFKAMRVSEAYLIRAEAYARNSQFALAEGDVFSVRSIRDGSAVEPDYDNIQTALSDILTERRIELAFEAHRFTDIRRMRDVLNSGIERDPADCNGGAIPCSLPVNSEKFRFPIPTVEINANPNITQTTGY